MGLVVPYLWIRNFNPCTSKMIIMCFVSANLIVCWLFCGFFCTITFLWFGFYYRDIPYFVFVEMWFDPSLPVTNMLYQSVSVFRAFIL